MQHMRQTAGTVRPSHQARQHVVRITTGVPLAGQCRIDHAQVRSVTLDDAVLQENRILTAHAPGPFAESYHLLRTRILQRFRQNGWNSLAVTGPRASEGKTLTAINLAISMSRLVGYSVLLVDADLRHPAVLEQLGVPQRRGFRDYLTAGIPVDELLIRSDRLDDLVILPGGQSLDDAVGIMNPSRLRQLAGELKSRARNRILIFDLPPLRAGTWAQALLPCVDAALLVIEDGVTTRQDAERAKQMLAGTTLVGSVLNKVRGA